MLMRDLGRHRGKHHCSLLSLAPITFDANTLSCYGGSYFATIAVSVICRRPLNVVGPSMPTSSLLIITAIIARYSEYVPLQNCLLPLSFTAPEGAAVVYTNTSVIFFQSYITRAWGMPASFVHSCILFFFLSYTSLRRSRYRFLFPPTDRSKGSHYLLSLTTTFSVEETLMDFGYTYAPNLIHQGASVITEISSTQGDKNSASSTQQ
jgi:hypothetical protein